MGSQTCQTDEDRKFKVRKRWKTLMEEILPKIEAGEVVEVSIESTSDSTGIRNAARPLGVTVLKQGEVVLLKKGEFAPKITWRVLNKESEEK